MGWPTEELVAGVEVLPIDEAEAIGANDEASEANDCDRSDAEADAAAAAEGAGEDTAEEAAAAAAAAVEEKSEGGVVPDPAAVRETTDCEAILRAELYAMVDEG